MKTNEISNVRPSLNAQTLRFCFSFRCAFTELAFGAFVNVLLFSLRMCGWLAEVVKGCVRYSMIIALSLITESSKNSSFSGWELKLLSPAICCIDSQVRWTDSYRYTSTSMPTFNLRISYQKHGSAFHCTGQMNYSLHWFMHKTLK